MARVGKVATGAAAIRALSRQEAILLAGGAAVFVELNGPQIVFENIATGAKEIVNVAADMGASTRSALHKLLGTGDELNAARKVIMTPETARGLGQSLDALAVTEPIYITVDRLGVVPLKSIRFPNGIVRHLVELRSGLVVDLQDKLTDDILDLLGTSVKSEHIRVLSLFDPSDPDTIKRLADAVGDRLIDGKSIRNSSGKLTLSQFDEAIIIAVGHVEDKDFVVRTAAGNIAYRLGISELEAAADEAGATLLSAGCSCFTAGARSGFVNNVTDVSVATSMSNALAANNYADLLAAFGTPEAPFAITSSALKTLAERNVLELERLV